jgi:hypothetical protein
MVFVSFPFCPKTEEILLAYVIFDDFVPTCPLNVRHSGDKLPHGSLLFGLFTEVFPHSDALTNSY